MQIQLSIEHKSKTIPFQVEFRKRRTMEIRIQPPDQITVIAPLRLSKDTIIKEVQGKADWIIKKLSEYENLNYKNLKKEYIDGEVFMYLGNQYPLLIMDANYKIPRVKFQDNTIVISTSTKEEENLKNALEKWYREKALEVITERIKYYEPYFKVRPSGIVIKEQKKRWGSCTSEKKLLFNWRLIMAPIPVIDYVIVHEMSHMIHMDHSKNFWNQVESILPDYKDRKKWLKLNGILMDL
jgi:predicted metal-dependent hydrolase